MLHIGSKHTAQFHDHYTLMALPASLAPEEHYVSRFRCNRVRAHCYQQQVHFNAQNLLMHVFCVCDGEVYMRD
jgi:hypothetical protein